MKNLYIFAAVILFLASCDSQTFTTEGGTTVTYHKKGSGPLPVDSLINFYYIKYTTENGYTLADTDPSEPRPLQINKNLPYAQGELFEVLRELKVGDSVTFELAAGPLFEKTFGAPLPDSIAAESKIKFNIACLDQKSEDAYMEELAEKNKAREEAQLAFDKDAIVKFLEENNLEATETESGLFYIITKDGNGKQPEIGQTVQVNYAGRILSGAYFDTSIEDVAKEQGLYNPGRSYGPFEFPLGQGRVIRGWDEGIALLSVGTEATLYIPSGLGYGQRSTGPIIGPNSILVFDVELVGIK